VKFAINAEARNKILVVRNRDLAGPIESTGVMFELRAHDIAISEVKTGMIYGASPLFSAVPRLNEEADCLLEVEGQTLRLWQVSRKALEDLFFGFDGG
jgi:hypothetical protein